MTLNRGARNSAGRRWSKLDAIFLVGFMGAGKTSVGRALAEQLGWRFIDLDGCIEARQKRSIADIFRDSGERAFRSAESAELRQVLAELAPAPAVVALGGGTFVQAENAQLTTQCSGCTVFLDAPVGELWRRAQTETGERPLAAAENQFRQLYELRRQRYMEADLTIETLGRTVQQVVADIVSKLHFRLSKGESQ